MKIIKYLMIVCFFAALLGCSGKRAVFADNDNPEIVKLVAVQIVDLIHQEKNIRETVITLSDKEKPVEIEVLAELKKRGFALADDGGTPTTVTVQDYGKKKIYLSVTVGKMILSRIFIYDARTDTLIPDSPLCKGDA